MTLSSILSVLSNSLLLVVLSGCQLANKNNNQSESEASIPSLTETYWKLIELKGQRVPTGASKKSEVHFILHAQDQRIVGFNGCNRFFGQFKITRHSPEHGQLTLSALGATKKACQGLAINEQSVMRAFINQVSYQIKGKTLSLFDQNSNPLAKFHKVYF